MNTRTRLLGLALALIGFSVTLAAIEEESAFMAMVLAAMIAAAMITMAR